MSRVARMTRCLVVAVVFSGCGHGAAPTPQQGTLTILSGDSQTATVAAQLATQLGVRALDTTGAPMSGVTIRWTAPEGSGSLFPATSITDTDGIARCTWTLGTVAGVQHVVASIGTFVVSFSATAQPAAAVSLQITGPPSLLTDEVISLSAIPIDAYGNSTGGTIEASYWVADEFVLKVNPDNTITGLYPGTKTINAYAGDLAGSRLETVNPRITFEFGAEEVVFRYATDRCEQYDLPDQPARIIRLADSSLVMIDSDEPRYYASYGADFNSLKRSCTPVFSSDRDLTPQSYNNREWLWAPYREGSNIHAIVHNEYHDPFSFNCLRGDDTAANPCWYNSLTYAVSTDAGRTFTHAPPPGHMLAPAPWVWDPAAARVYGYFAGSNILRADDGLYYRAFYSWVPTGGYLICMTRTATLADPSSWRAWDGEGFNLAMTSPYLGGAPSPCATVSPEPYSLAPDSLTYNTYLGKYMLVGASVISEMHPTGCGIAYLTSPDLVHWSRQQLMLPGNLVWSPCNGGLPMMLAAAVIDHDDTTDNFERPGRSFYLYYTRFNDPYLDRDLVRLPVTVTEH